MITTGTTPISTTNSSALQLLASASGYGKIVLINEGPTAGLFSLDGGNTWARLPAAAAASAPVVITIENKYQPVNLQVMNAPGGGNLSGLWAWAV